jgi:hypothetical protein
MNWFRKKQSIKKNVPLNEIEKDLLAEEIYSRLKDIFFINSEKRIEEFMEIFSSMSFGNKDIIKFNYEVTMLGYDILQIVGRIRREAERKEVFIQ